MGAYISWIMDSYKLSRLCYAEGRVHVRVSEWNQIPGGKEEIYNTAGLVLFFLGFAIQHLGIRCIPLFFFCCSSVGDTIHRTARIT